MKGMIEGFFGGFEMFDFGMFCTFGKYFFMWLDLRGDLSRKFFGYSKQSEDSRYCPSIPATYSSVNKIQPNLFCGRFTYLTHYIASVS